MWDGGERKQESGKETYGLSKGIQKRIKDGENKIRKMRDRRQKEERGITEDEKGEIRRSGRKEGR